MKPDLILWFVSAIASGVLALICAVATIVNAQNLPWAASVGGVDPHSLGSALIAATGVLVFGLVCATCTVVYAVVSRAAVPSGAAPRSLESA
jgi:hypothetical protein